MLAGLAPETKAAWPRSPGVNVPLCTAAGHQQDPTIVSDGAGGAIVTWQDGRSGSTWDIYAQHVLASGAVDGAWPADGRSLCTAANDQLNPTIVSDGTGGAIVTWVDLRSGNYDIYAQHVLASGAVDGGWPADGRALCTAANDQTGPTIVSDGAGGAIVTWQDRRSGANTDIYAQHILASGAVDGLWPADGRALCTAANFQLFPTLVSDRAGGAIVTWQDGRSGTDDIYAQHVLASGAVDGSWPVDGRALCTAASGQVGPMIVSDGAGGAIVSWHDSRTGSYDIYAQHVLASGAVDGAWPVDGRALCIAIRDQYGTALASDGAGGAIVTWYDYRSGTNNDIYAQHVLPWGAVDGAWPVDGRALCTAAGDQVVPRIVSDGAAGAIVTWYDLRNGANYDIYAQHVLASGAVDVAWPADGRALCSAAGHQAVPTIVSDGAGGAIVTWYDQRSGTTNDIYAQRVGAFGYLGAEPTITSVRDVPNDNGGVVKLSWSASYLDTEQPYVVDHYWVFRAAPPSLAQQALARGARLLRSTELEPLPGEQAFLATTVNSTTYYWEYVGTVAATHFSSTYSYLAPTTSDSIAAGNPRTAFIVVAYDLNHTVYFASNPDSGYSVDNLPPTTPTAFTGLFSGQDVHLHWAANPEADFGFYHLHRGSSASFVPGPGNLVTSQPDTGYVDVTSAWNYYKLSALDIHGNQSGFALLSPGSSFAGATPTGSNVVVPLGSTVQLTYQNVTSGGQSQLSTQPQGTPPPGDLKIVPSSPTLYYVITTTATFTGSVTVCVTYRPGDVNGNENNLKLMHYDTTLPSPAWVNITASRDTAANRICGTTTHFSEFAIMEPVSPTAVDDAPPSAIRLYPCSPNPSRGPAMIRFGLPRDGRVALAIYDTGGRRVAELARGVLSAGEHAMHWDGRDAAGRAVASGLYLVRLETEAGRLTQKLIAVR